MPMLIVPTALPDVLQDVSIAKRIAMEGGRRSIDPVFPLVYPVGGSIGKQSSF